jgi:hypothetical protein
MKPLAPVTRTDWPAVDVTRDDPGARQRGHTTPAAADMPKASRWIPVDRRSCGAAGAPRSSSIRLRQRRGPALPHDESGNPLHPGLHADRYRGSAVSVGSRACSVPWPLGASPAWRPATMEAYSRVSRRASPS